MKAETKTAEDFLAEAIIDPAYSTSRLAYRAFSPQYLEKIKKAMHEHTRAALEAFREECADKAQCVHAVQGYNMQNEPVEMKDSYYFTANPYVDKDSILNISIEPFIK